MILDEIHLLGEERGPVLEVIVSRMRFISSHTKSPIRFVGLSTALANARDLGDWLGISNSVGVYNFRPSVRPVPMSIYIQGFPGNFVIEVWNCVDGLLLHLQANTIAPEWQQ